MAAGDQVSRDLDRNLGRLEEFLEVLAWDSQYYLGVVRLYSLMPSFSWGIAGRFCWGRFGWGTLTISSNWVRVILFCSTGSLLAMTIWERKGKERKGKERKGKERVLTRMTNYSNERKFSIQIQIQTLILLLFLLLWNEEGETAGLPWCFEYQWVLIPFMVEERNWHWLHWKPSTIFNPWIGSSDWGSWVGGCCSFKSLVKVSNSGEGLWWCLPRWFLKFSVRMNPHSVHERKPKRVLKQRLNSLRRFESKSSAESPE